jgi:hypothetical protein
MLQATGIGFPLNLHQENTAPAGNPSAAIQNFYPPGGIA